MSQFKWNICLLRFPLSDRVWRLRVGRVKRKQDETSGWHGHGWIRWAFFAVAAHQETGGCDG